MTIEISDSLHSFHINLNNHINNLESLRTTSEPKDSIKSNLMEHIAFFKENMKFCQADDPMVKLFFEDLKGVIEHPNLSTDKTALENTITQAFASVVSVTSEHKQEFVQVIADLVQTLDNKGVSDLSNQLSGIDTRSGYLAMQEFEALLKGNNLLLILEHGNEKTINYVFEHCDIDVNAKNESGQTVLHQFFDESLSGKVSNIALSRLLQHGADSSAKDKEGLTPLHYAAINDNLDGTKLLVHSGADHNAKSNVGGLNPMEFALVFGPTNPSVEFLHKTSVKKMAVQLANTPNLPKNLPRINPPVHLKIATNAKGTIAGVGILHKASNFVQKVASSVPEIADKAKFISENLEIPSAIASSSSIPVNGVVLYGTIGQIQTRGNVYQKEVQRMQEQIGVLDQLISQSPSSAEGMIAKEKKQQLEASLSKTQDRMEAETNKAKANCFAQAVKLAKQTSVAATPLSYAQKSTQIAFTKTVGTFAGGLLAAGSINKNWDEIENLQTKAEDLSFIKTTLTTQQNELTKLLNDFPSESYNSKLIGLKLKQLNQKSIHIDKELAKIGTQKNAHEWANYGQYASLALFTGALLNIPYSGTVAGAIGGISGFVPNAVKLNFLAKGAVQAVRQKASTVSEGYSEGQVRAKQVPKKSDTQEYVRAKERLDALSLEQKAAIGLGIPLGELAREIDELENALDEPSIGLDQSNNDIMAQVLSLAGVDVTNYQTERRKLILKMLTQ